MGVLLGHVACESEVDDGAGRGGRFIFSPFGAALAEPVRGVSVRLLVDGPGRRGWWGQGPSRAGFPWMTRFLPPLIVEDVPPGLAANGHGERVVLALGLQQRNRASRRNHVHDVPACHVVEQERHPSGCALVGSRREFWAFRWWAVCCKCSLR